MDASRLAPAVGAVAALVGFLGLLAVVVFAAGRDGATAAETAAGVAAVVGVAALALAALWALSVDETLLFSFPSRYAWIEFHRLAVPPLAGAVAVAGGWYARVVAGG